MRYHRCITRNTKCAPFICSVDPKRHPCVNIVLLCLNNFITSFANPGYACNKPGYKLEAFLGKVHLRSHHGSAPSLICRAHICRQADFPSVTLEISNFVSITCPFILVLSCNLPCIFSTFSRKLKSCIDSNSPSKLWIHCTLEAAM